MSKWYATKNLSIKLSCHAEKNWQWDYFLTSSQLTSNIYIIPTQNSFQSDFYAIVPVTIIDCERCLPNANKVSSIKNFFGNFQGENFR